MLPRGAQAHLGQHVKYMPCEGPPLYLDHARAEGGSGTTLMQLSSLLLNRW